MRYNNYHRHDFYSNTRTPDVIVSPQNYIDRIIELNHTNYFTTNHGCSGNIYEAYELCKKNNLKCIFGMELYYVDNRFEKEGRNNYHLVAIALNKEGMWDINRINAEANDTGFHYHPRTDKELILSLNPKNVIITTACINNILNKEENMIENFLIPMKNHFKEHFFLEIQSHEHEKQVEWNVKIKEISKEYNIEIIHGCDSHFILKEDAKDRLEYLNGKGMNYGEENEFILDYPESKKIFNRYNKQGVFTESEIRRALENTLIFDKAEDLGFSYDVKMPTIYKDLSLNERYQKLKSIITEKFIKKMETVDPSRVEEYKKAVQFELDIIRDTNTEEIRMADYFLINEKIIKLGVEKYGGTITRTGRGSAVSFEVNHLLGFTEVDRLDAEVPLYATRFLSKSRALDAKSMPDIDFNVADDIPFINASVEVMGQDHCYQMISYGKLKTSGAFRTLCRARKYEMDEYNEFGKKLSEIEAINDKETRKSKFEEMTKDSQWGNLLLESKKFNGVIESVSPSPCSHLLYDGIIPQEIGLIKIKDKMCCCMDKDTADVWKFLKNDILIVTVWDIISKVYKNIGKKIPTIKELKSLLDDSVWKLYEDGITKTLNQADSDFSTDLVMKYIPKTPAELTAFVAAIRPSFASLLHGFLNREEYTTGTEQLDELLSNSFHYLLYQENIMAYLTWLGIPEDETYEIIKKIAKKKFKEKELKKLEKTLHENWISKIGNDDNFIQTWEVIQNAAAYGFNSSHALSVAWDSLYGAELKAHHPLEYYKVILSTYEDKVSRTAGIHNELDYFKINVENPKFRYSNSDYSINKEKNTIYKGMASIKNISRKCSDELYELRNNEYKDFISLLYDIEKTSLNSLQLTILIKLDFFSEMGGSQYLLDVVDIFNKYSKAKTLSKSKLDEATMSIVSKYCTATDKQLKILNNTEIMTELVQKLDKNKSIILSEQLASQLEYFGYITFIDESLDEDIYYVTQITKKFTHPQIYLYNMSNGEIRNIKCKNKVFNSNKFKVGDMIKVYSIADENKWRKTDNPDKPFEMIKDQYEPILKSYSILMDER